MNPLLSIVIPTYNRPEKVVQRISELLPQLENATELVILDNGSDAIIETYVTERIPEAVQRVRFIRNQNNIGLGANVCRSFEHAYGVWTWILGDDDTVRPDAVSILLRTIADASTEVGFINFSTPFNGYEKEISVSSESELLQLAEERSHVKYFLSNIVFISVGCYRSSLFNSFWRTGYAMSSSHCPHFAMILAFLIERKGKIFFSPEQILHWDKETSGLDWSRIKLMLGSSTLVEIDGGTRYTHEIVKRLISEFEYTRFLRNTIAMMLGDLRRPWQFWRYFLGKMLLVGTWKLKMKSMVALSLLPLAMIPLFRNVLSKIIAKRKATDSTKGENRL